MDDREGWWERVRNIRAIRRLARINEIDPRLKQICAKEVKSTEGITRPKDFNTRMHLKYELLIGGDQTNNDEISETVLFPFSFLLTI